MPLLGNGEYKDPDTKRFSADPTDEAPKKIAPTRRQSQHSGIAKSAIMSQIATPSSEDARTPENDDLTQIKTNGNSSTTNGNLLPSQPTSKKGSISDGRPLSDTPTTSPSTTAASSPIIHPQRRDSGASTPSRPRAATTLDIPGLTKSKVSPDGRISQRDVGSKLVIVMVGLPARGKSYITKKMARYLNWLQHDTKIFNVGERRRVVAGASSATKPPQKPKPTPRDAPATNGDLHDQNMLTPPTSPTTTIRLNDSSAPATPPLEKLPPSALESSYISLTTTKSRTREPEHEDQEAPPKGELEPEAEPLEQSANFFDPSNEKAAIIREQCAMETLDELLDFVLDQGGSVGIFDATNSTLERRKAIVERVRARAGPDLGVLFLESLCIDDALLESNMRLKLSGPDYKDQDATIALEDFKKRVEMYQQKYVSLGDYEEKNNMPYIQMIDVGRKIISHQIRGFLSAQTNYYLLNFNLAPRQIWITRHGESVDNVRGKIGGDSDLTEKGRSYAKALNAFVKTQRDLWEIHQQDKALSTHFPPQPGDTTPPNPSYEQDSPMRKNFCVWTSMLKRSIQTAEHFDEEEFDVKQMRMLDELNSGIMEGLTYADIKSKHAMEYARRKLDKLHYRYPGPGGEGYLDIINRLRPVIHEVERMTDHVILVGHRSVARVLLAYFKGLKREEVADLDVPLGMLYMLEPKPYGVEFKAYRYNAETEWFELVPEYELQRAAHSTAS